MLNLRTLWLCELCYLVFYALQSISQQVDAVANRKSSALVLFVEKYGFLTLDFVDAVSYQQQHRRMHIPKKNSYMYFIAHLFFFFLFLLADAEGCPSAFFLSSVHIGCWLLTISVNHRVCERHMTASFDKQKTGLFCSCFIIVVAFEWTSVSLARLVNTYSSLKWQKLRAYCLLINGFHSDE